MPDILSGGAPSQTPSKWPPKIELDQLGRQPLETCCKMSSTTPGTKVARCLSEFMSTNISPRGAFGGLKSQTKFNLPKVLTQTLNNDIYKKT